MFAPLCRAILPTIRWRVMRTFTPAVQTPVGLIILPYSRRLLANCGGLNIGIAKLAGAMRTPWFEPAPPLQHVSFSTLEENLRRGVVDRSRRMLVDNLPTV